MMSGVLIAALAAAPPSETIQRTETALVEQLRCREEPKVALAINAMLRNRLVRYEANESGVYLFAPTVPLKFLGLPITHISGFDREIPFRRVPDSRMVGTAPPQFIQIDVAAPAGELKRRAMAAGFVERVPGEDRLGFTVEDGGHNLAGKSRSTISSIECAN